MCNSAIPPTILPATAERRRVTNRGRNFALENRDRGERERMWATPASFLGAGDIFSAAAYLAIWPLSSDLQGGQDKRTNLRGVGLVLGAFSAKFRRKQDKLRCKFANPPPRTHRSSIYCHAPYRSFGSRQISRSKRENARRRTKREIGNSAAAITE